MKKLILFQALILLIAFSSCDKEEPEEKNDLTEITYPQSGKWGINILNESDSILSVGEYSMAADLPEESSLKIIFNGDREGNLSFEIGQDNTGFDDYDSDESGEWRTLKSNRTGRIDMKMQFFEDVEIQIFENDSIEPTRIKRLYKQN